MHSADKVGILCIVVFAISLHVTLLIWTSSPITMKCKVLEKEYYIYGKLNVTSKEFAFDHCPALRPVNLLFK
jgi:hypothetical protein